jgi:hypothetical protein
MATTTNYGWDTPDDTDLVKDGALAMRDLGQDIDTSLYGIVGGNAKVGMHLLSTTTLSGASTTISGISQAYADLEIWVYGMTNATTSGYFRCAPNGLTTLAHASGTSNLGGVFDLRGMNNEYLQNLSSTIERTNANNAVKIRIENYASTTNFKTFTATYSFIDSGATRSTAENYGGAIKTNSAISSLVFSNSGGGTFSTGTVKIWGCN